MKTIKEKAVQSFKSGLNCAQSVLTAYSEDLKFDNNLALSLSCAFGGGMGRLQETCGAVTGAFMVLGIHNSNKYSDNKDRKDNTYAQVQDYAKQFKAIHDIMDCKHLLNCDLKTKEGQQFFHEQNLHERVCVKCIADSIEIVNGLINVSSR